MFQSNLLRRKHNYYESSFNGNVYIVYYHDNKSNNS